MRRLALSIAAVIVLGASAGCSRKAYTRVFVHGEVENDRGETVPYAIVRVDGYETLSDAKGHYRLLYLASCLRAGAGIQGVQTPDLEVFARDYEKHVLGFHLDSIEVVGGGSCPADTDKYLRLLIERRRTSKKGEP